MDFKIVDIRPKGDNLFLEFFDGIWGHYTFESDKVNTLIDALPSFAYPLGQLVFLILVYRLLVHQYIKRFLTMYLSIYVIGIKKRFEKVNYLC